MADIARVKQLLPPRRGNGDNYVTNCPGPLHANGDRKPSLSVSRGRDGGNLVLHCFAGCRTEEILEAVGLSWADICEDKPGVLPNGQDEPGLPNGQTRPGLRRYYR
jgi:hypothetical protein